MFYYFFNLCIVWRCVHTIPKYIVDELWELIQLSGVPLNREVSKIVSLHNTCLLLRVTLQIIELLKLNVPPSIILQMLKTLRSDNVWILCFQIY